MEYNEENKIEESIDQEMDMEEESGSSRQWFQDNLRVIVSVLIVVVIAGGIYSYSRRTEAPTQEGTTTESASLLNPSESEKVSTDKSITTDKSNENKNAQTDKDKSQTNSAQPAKTQEKTIASSATSQETDKSFVETAGKGDSQTKLARRALANYLEKSSDSSLTAEHKIYIEDYLRKKVAHKGRVLVGTSVEFDKNLIQNAIAQAKNLNQRQLQNLHKYAVRVPSL
jgi:hypothetical protein